MTDQQLDLNPLVVHCAFCVHTETAYDPHTAHRLMERHYAAKHEAVIRELCGERSARHHQPRRDAHVAHPLLNVRRYPAVDREQLPTSPRVLRHRLRRQLPAARPPKPRTEPRA